MVKVKFGLRLVKPFNISGGTCFEWIVIWSTSRAQKCVSLSEQKPSGMRQLQQFAILFLHHIPSFLTDDEVGPVILHTDNSAVKMLSNKLVLGLRHVKGRILWLQAKVLSCDLCIKQVKTLHNIADLNTKSLTEDRHLFLLHMLVLFAVVRKR